MNINKPIKIENLDKVISDLKKLDWIELNGRKNKEYIIIKRVEKLKKFRDFIGNTWIGQILYNKKDKNYYFRFEMFESSNFGNIEDWDKIKEFMNIFEEKIDTEKRLHDLLFDEKDTIPIENALKEVEEKDNDM